MHLRKPQSFGRSSSVDHPTADQEHRTIVAGGEMAERFRSFDWSETSLGPLDGWPDSLVSTAATLLESPFPQILLCGPEFIVCAYNDAYRPLLGNKPEALGRSYLEVYPEAKDFTANLLQEALAGKSCRIEGGRFTLLRNGAPAEAFVDFALSPVRGPRGEMLGVLNLVNETTAGKQAEEALRESELRYRSLFASMREAFCIVERVDNEAGQIIDFRFMVANPAVTQQTGVVDVVGKTIRDVVPDDAAIWIAMGDHLLRTGMPVWEERPLVSLGRILEVRAYRLEDGTNRRIAIMFTDVTGRRRAEEAIREADREKTEFLAVLSHELRNPLAPLRSGVELLESVRSDPDLLNTLRPMLERQLAHLVRLVDDLLDISRISRGKVELQKTDMDLIAPVETAIEQMRPLIAAHQHELRVRLSSTPLPIRGDLERLTQVVSNLLSNAANYTEPGGTITLVTDSEAGQAVIRVRDTGYGIPPERMGRLFEMFSQVPEHRRKTGGGGLGVGLALSKRLLELHGGSITARSRGLGFGSEFIVHVPLAEATHQKPSPGPAEVAGAQARRVLVVDDNIDAAEILQIQLGLLGQEVTIANDGPTALREIERFHPDLILLDLGMPGMDGLEVAQRARSMPEGKDATIVAVTGWGQEEDKTRTREAGFDEHFTKPISAKQLRSILSHME